MSNTFFQFKQFIVHQDKSAMKVTTDSCLFGSILPGLPDEGKEKKVLDIGTGTGLLSSLFAQRNPQAIIDAIEIDHDTYLQATENVSLSPWKDNIQVVHADVKHFSFSKKYDVIICNPPFYENELKGNDTKKNIAHHSKDLSISQLLSVIQQVIKKDGAFYLLLPYKRKEEIIMLVKGNGFVVPELISVKQSPTHDYFRIILTGKQKGEAMVETKNSEISIWNEQKEYTPGFVSLLKSYYLKL